jgi:ABC-type protease/lipase transport system fused ATPase/permease subunit
VREARFTLRPLHRPFWVLCFFGFASGLLGALGAVFISLVYDHVLRQRSLTQLGIICLLFAGLYVAHGALKAITGRMAEAMGLALLDAYEPSLLRLSAARLTQGMMPMEARAPLQDLAEVAGAIRGPVLAALLDLLFVPVLLIILLMISPYLFAFALLVLGVQLALALRVAQANPQEASFGDRRAKSRPLRPGLEPETAEERAAARHAYSQSRQFVRDAKGLTLTLRDMGQSGILAMGAWLVMIHDLSIGKLMAIGFIMIRIYSPVQALGREIGGLRTSIAAYRRLHALPGIEGHDALAAVTSAQLARSIWQGIAVLALCLGVSVLYGALTPLRL